VKALITGGAGFVGRSLRAHLEASGDTVTTTDRSAGGPDITDRDGLMRFWTDVRADVVYHLAAQSHVPTSWTDPIGTLRVNVEGTQNVLDASRESGATRVIVVTSAEVYGKVTPDQLPIDEETPLRPVTPYAASKVAADAVSLQAHLGHGQDVIRLRAFNHIGPGQSDQFVAAGLAGRIAQAEASGGTEIAVGNLSPRRDFTDVRDIVRAYRLIAERGTAGEVYNVCTGTDRSIAELSNGLLALTTHTIEPVADPELQRAVDVPVVRGDSSKLRKDTGWAPAIEFTTSLQDILDDARSRLHD
jgi:GDP-4-dehydro-6-deoxy-D-mannose reductase